VTLRELLQSEDWNASAAKLPIALGKDVYGKTIIADLAQMPHLLVAGTTGSGKSVCINALIASMLYRFTPDQLRFIMIDPKVVEMQVYNSLPHLVIPVVTDPKKVLLALRWVIDEMEKRYKIFAKAGVRNITGFNARPAKKTQKELEVEGGALPAGGGMWPARLPLQRSKSRARRKSLSLIICLILSSSLTSWLT
jgi:S-DNA-T family DNA segregation ATPase FtsK/SpoIIIE